jgi:hypothetical protein
MLESPLLQQGDHPSFDSTVARLWKAEKKCGIPATADAATPMHLAGAAEATSIRELLQLWRKHFDCVAYVVAATTTISLAAMYFISFRNRSRTRPAIERSERRVRYQGLGQNGAQERTRTFTAVKPLAPEASASTNSATWARAG